MKTCPTDGGAAGWTEGLYALRAYCNDSNKVKATNLVKLVRLPTLLLD